MTDENKSKTDQKVENSDILDDITSKLSELDKAESAVNAGKQVVDKVVQHVEQLKINLDSSANQIKSQAEQIDKLQTAAELSQGKISEIKGSSETELKNIVEVKTQLTQTKKNIDFLVQELNDQKTKIEKSVKDTSDKISNIEDSYNKIKEIEKQSEIYKQSIKSHLDQSNEDQKSISAILSTATQQNTELQTKLSEVNSKASEINSKNDEIRMRQNEILDTYNKLLVDEKDENEKIIKKSMKTEIVNLFEQSKENQLWMKNFSDEQKETFKDLHIELNNQITSLLPSAGAAGLASTYFQAKRRYGYVDEQLGMTGIKKVLIKIGNFLSESITKTWIYYFLFITPLIVWTCSIYSPILKFFGLYTIASSMAIPTPITWEWVITRLLFGAPFFLLSYFGWSSIGLNRRLYEEYNHKQRVMELYHSFHDEILKTSDDVLKVKLLNIMLDTVQDKPSAIMHKYDQHPIDKFKPEIPDIIKGTPFSHF